MFIPLRRCAIADHPLPARQWRAIAVNVLVLLYSHLILGGTSEEQFQMVTGIIPAVLYDRATLRPISCTSPSS